MGHYLTLVLLAVGSRIIPHPPNFAPVGGLSLFVGTTALDQKSKWGKIAAYTIPFITMLVSDWLIGFDIWQVTIAVYLSFLANIGIGFIVRKHYSWKTIVLGSLVGSIIFYLLTNAAVWAFTTMYPKTLAGLVESYIMALPFFRNTILGDLVYTGTLFGVYELAKNPLVMKRLWRTIQHSFTSY